MKRIRLADIPESLVEFSRERYKSELAQGIFDLMETQGVKRSQLAELLDVDKSRITHLLTGSENLGAETIADVFLVLGRAAHLTLGTDLETVRMPVDEAKSPEPSALMEPIATGSYSYMSTITGSGNAKTVKEIPSRGRNSFRNTSDAGRPSGARGGRSSRAAHGVL